MSNVRANLWKLYAYKFISEFYLIVPVLIPYYMAHGLSSTQVFTIQAAYALAVLLLEVPSGYLADVAGRKTTLILGAAAMPIASVGAPTVSITTSTPRPPVISNMVVRGSC